MQPYYVASTDALKKRIKQFHAELKKHKKDITLGWSRDFVSKLLFWGSWNELYIAHQKEFSSENHRRKLFNRDFLPYKEQLKALQDVSYKALSLDSPDLNEDARVACSKALWALPYEPPKIPDNLKLSKSLMPDDYRLDNSFLSTEKESLYNEFMLNVTTPIFARNGGILICEAEDFESYYNKLSLFSLKINVLNASIMGCCFRRCKRNQKLESRA